MMDWQEKSLKGFLVHKSVRDCAETAAVRGMGKHVARPKGMGEKMRELHTKALSEVIRAGKNGKAQDRAWGNSSSDSEFEIWGLQTAQEKHAAGSESAGGRGTDSKQRRMQGKLARQELQKERADGKTRWNKRPRNKPKMSVGADALVPGAGHTRGGGGSSTSSAPPTPTQPYTSRPRGWVVGRCFGDGGKGYGDARGRSVGDKDGASAACGSVTDSLARTDSIEAGVGMEEIIHERVAVAVGSHVDRAMSRIEHTLQQLVAKKLARSPEGSSADSDKGLSKIHGTDSGSRAGATVDVCSIQPPTGSARAARGKGSGSLRTTVVEFVGQDVRARRRQDHNGNHDARRVRPQTFREMLEGATTLRFLL